MAMPPMRWSHRRSFSEAGDDEVGGGEEDVDADKDEEEEEKEESGAS